MLQGVRRGAAACLMASLGSAVFAVSCIGPAVADAVPSAPQATYVIGTGGVQFSLTKGVSPTVASVSTATGRELTAKTYELRSFGASAGAYQNYSVASPDPEGVQAVGSGSVVVADPANRLALWIGNDGRLLWGLGTSDDPALQSPVSIRKLPTSFSFLIVDRDAQRVFIADSNKVIRWQYGTTGVAGSGAGQLDSPTYADLDPDGNVVICDAGNHRVIAVRRSDDHIVWQYGTTGVSGSGVDRLVRPTSVQWLTAGAHAGNALICDQGAGRVLEVRSSDYRTGYDQASVVWEYPAGDGSGQPSCALGMSGSDDAIWVSDPTSGRVFAVATKAADGSMTGHEKAADLGSGAPGFTGSLISPVSLSLGEDGSVWVADPGARRVVQIGTKSKPPASAASRALTAGWTGHKRFTNVTVSYVDIPMTRLKVRFQVDGTGWRPSLSFAIRDAGDVGTGLLKTASFALPPKTAGTTIRYMFEMNEGQPALPTGLALVPRVTSLAIDYQRIASTSGTGGGGEGGNSKGASGDGTFGYPESTGGGGQGSGGGTVGGAGSGSGAGTTSGFGSGSTGSVTGGAAETAAAPIAGGATGQDLPSAVDPAAQTAPGSEAIVSGYRMRASGFAGGGEGGGSTPRQPVTAGAWMLIPAALGAFSLLLLAGAAARENRRVRLYADFDPGRPRGLPGDVTPTARPPLPPPIIRS